MPIFLFRKGDGNDGNYPRALVDIPDRDSLWSALRALTANLYVTRSRTRRHIIRSFEMDWTGDADSGVHGAVYEGPDGEMAFGAAWLTAELQPVEPDDLDYMTERHGAPLPLRSILDRAALATFRKYNH